MRAAGCSLLLPFYFIAERRKCPIDDVRQLTFCEFMSWLNYFDFYGCLEKR